MATRIQQRRGTAAEWVAANPILAEGEIGIDLDDGLFKLGNGVDHWADLPTSGTAQYGFAVVIGNTQPGYTTVDGQPVVWVKGNSTLTAISTTPTDPSFNLTTFTVTAPTVTGVEYQIVDGVNIIPLVNGVETSVSGYARPYTLTIQAAALPGYVLTSTYQWQRLLTDSSNLVNWANDSFAGTAGAQLATGGNTSQRTWDMVGGGNASPTPVWYTNTSAGVGGGMQIAANGTSTTKSTATGVDTSHTENFFNVGQANMEVQVVVGGFLVEHSEAFTIFLGGTTSSGTNAVMPKIVYDSGSGVMVTFQASGTVAEQSTSWKPAGTAEATILGTWRFQWVGKFCQVIAPDGQTFGRDYSSSGVTYGNWGGIGVSNFNTRTRFVSFDSIKVLR